MITKFLILAFIAAALCSCAEYERHVAAREDSFSVTQSGGTWNHRVEYRAFK